MSDNVAAVSAPVESVSEAPIEGQEVQAVEGDEGLDAAEAAAVEAESKAKPVKQQIKAAKELEKRIKKLKLKVDGHEVEQDFDMNDEAALVRELQMSKMGQKRAQEKAELEKQLGSFFKELQRDPFGILAREMKMNPDQLIEQYINQQLENAKKSPAQLDKERLEAELTKLKQDRELERQAGQQKELERLQQQEFTKIDMQMTQAMDKAEIPKSPYYVKKIADYMLAGISAGYDVSPDDVIPLVQEELKSDLKAMFEVLPEDVIEGMIGEQMLNKLRKRRVAKAQEASAKVGKPQISDTGKANKPVVDKSKLPKKNFKDFFGV